MSLGADVNHHDQSIMLCPLNKDLYDACKRGDVTRIKELLSLGADVNHHDQSIMLCPLNKELYDVCKRGDVKRIKEILSLTNQLIAKSLKDTRVQR